MSAAESEVRRLCAALWPGCRVSIDTHKGGRGRATTYSVMVTEGRAVRVVTIPRRLPSDAWHDAGLAVERALIAATPREERQTHARAWALYPGCVLRLVTVSDGRAAVQLTGEGGTWQTTYAPAATPAQAWAHAAADLRADAERELAAMAARVDRIGRALEVE